MSAAYREPGDFRQRLVAALEEFMAIVVAEPAATSFTVVEYMSTHELFSRLGFFELPAAGPPALDRADAVRDTFTALVGPNAPRASRLSPTVLAAIASGIWSAIQHEIAHGELDSLPGKAPQIVRIAMPG